MPTGFWRRPRRCPHGKWRISFWTTWSWSGSGASPSRAVRLNYQAPDGEQYEFNLIDTPGHVDFHYEVSRSLNACDGALLVVDATQGIEAQTLANAYLAADANLEIVPVINKIDLPSADVERVREEIEDVIGIPAEGCPAVSAKTGLNIEQVLEAVVENIPAPVGDPDAPLKALIFDSYYDSYLGVVVYVRVFDGSVKSGDRIRLMSNGAVFDVVDVGCMTPFGLKKADLLSAGEVGYLTASIKSVGDTRVGDTVTLAVPATLDGEGRPQTRVIDLKHCLHCGRCAEICSIGAIESRF